MGVVHRFIALVCLVLGAQQAECAQLRCIDGTERALSLDDANLPPAMFDATSEGTSDPSTEFTDFGFAVDFQYNAWCASSSDPSPSITVFFVNPVLVTSLLSGGLYSSISQTRYYVNNFTLEYAASPTDEFVFYNDSEYNTPKEFTVPELNSLLPLEEPILVDRLRFNVLGHFGTRRCWHVMIFGCLSSNAVTQMELPDASFSVSVISSETTGLVLPSSSIPSPFESTGLVLSPSSNPSPEMSTRVVKDYQTLAIVLPIALITIVLVAAIVVIGVFICQRNSKNMTHQSSRSFTPTASGEAPRDRSETIREVKNILYELRDEVDTTDRTYEVISETRQEEDDDTLVNNPIYKSVSLPEGGASSPEKVGPETGLVQDAYEPTDSAEKTAVSKENEYKEIA